MSTIINFNLSYTATLVNYVVCLFDPEPAFQYGLRSDGTYQILFQNQLSRDTSVASAGFAASEIQQVDLNGNIVSVPSTTQINLPANSYAINAPSRVYGTPQANDTYTVFQINAALAQVEPGFSRVLVNYQYYDATNNTFNTISEYFDCPFYEGFNVTARELNNLVNYVQDGYGFIQKEIDILTQEVKYALSRELWRGTSVSGQIKFSAATQGLEQGPINRGEFAHDADLEPKSAITLPSAAQLKSVAFNSGLYGTYSQTSPATESLITAHNFAGGHGYPEASFYMAEAVDATGTRCFIVVVASDITPDNSQSTQAFRFNFNTPPQNGAAVDRQIGSTSQTVYFNIIAKTTPNSQTIMNSYIPAAQPGEFGTGPGQYGVQIDERLGSTYYYNQTPVWFHGPSNNDGAGLFSPPQQSGSPGVPDGGYIPMQSGKADTVSFNGENYPRIVFYPSDGTTNLNLVGISAFFMTDDAYNGGGGGFTDTVYYPLNTNFVLTPVIPANGPVINANNTPSGACVGQTITVQGNYFNKNYDTAYVAGQPAPINVINANTCNVTIPSVGYGPTTLQLWDGHHPYSTIPFNVLGQPLLSGVNPTQSPPGTNITISGNNFGSQDSNSAVKFGNGFVANIVSWNNTSIVVTVPQIGLGPTQIQVFNDCGEATTGQFSVSNPDKVLLNPHVATVSENNTFQFSATYYAGTQGTDVTSNSATTWYVNNEVGGENVHGHISQNGLYTAPGSVPPDAIVVSIQYFDNNTGVFISDSANVNLVAAPTIHMDPANVNLAAGANQQFIVTLYANNTTTDVTNNCSYSVNGSPNGDVSEGIVSNSGLYTAPNNLSQATSEVVGATYVYNGQSLTAQSTVIVAEASTDHCSITVTSQLNIFLGDGRFGYVPTGTQLVAYPNQYIYVQFQELLDAQFHLPIASYVPVQQLDMQVKDALDSDIANVIYNLADLQVQSDGTTTTLRTVVLGIIDPSDGRWHSMWDIGNPLPGPAQGGHSFDLSELDSKSADSIKAFSNNRNGFKGSLTDYINDLSGGAQTQLDALNQKSNILLVGNCQYDINTNTFKILDGLHILKVSGENSYGILASIPKQEVKLEPNQYLYIDEDMNLKVKKLGDLFQESQNTQTIIVGTVLDRFYTTWPLLSMLDIDTSGVQEFGKTSIMNVGPLTIQWGSTEKLSLEKKSINTEHINFEKSFKKSLTVLTEPYNSSGGFINCQSDLVNVDGFDIKIVNSGSSKVTSQINWLAIGM